MSEPSPMYEAVERESTVRVRQETDRTFLLYHQGTDELHLIGQQAKSIFDLCDGRSIDEVVRQGACLLGHEADATTEAQVLDFLTSLHRRSLVRFV